MTQAKNTIYPKRLQVYTLAEIFNELYLRDSAFLNFWYQGKRCVIQTSHVLDAELLTVPGFSETKWTYIRETDEWCPIFQFVEQGDDITKYVDIEPSVPMFTDDEPGFWCTPKGFPRQQ